MHRRWLDGARREGLDWRDVAPGAPTPVDRRKLDMTATKATGCSVAWSDTELAPLVPMQLEV